MSRAWSRLAGSRPGLLELREGQARLAPQNDLHNQSHTITTGCPSLTMHKLEAVPILAAAISFTFR